ncbi:MAG: hypothetical protein FJX16_09125 [Alphaproteobacteria bacterium]|nr:hypothetical protein [Alphaproteobacteria bacterium]
MRDAAEGLVNKLIDQGTFTVAEKAPRPVEGLFIGGSVYRSAFRNGATLYPRKLCFIEHKSMGRLGVDTSAPYVISRRSRQTQRPWTDLPDIENRVEAKFLKPVLLGESILPYRVWAPLEAVIPVDEDRVVLDAEAAIDRGFDGLAGWMRKAEQLWNEGRGSEITLTQQLDHYGKLSSQFPLKPMRVVYVKAGINLSACVVNDERLVIDHKLYWSEFASDDEARYLTAILNSETTRSRAEKWQSRGQGGARDFDKVVFNLPIPRYDAKNQVHAVLTKAAAKAEKIAAAVVLPEGVKFQRARKLVRDALIDAGVSQEIDALVAKLLDS